MKPTTLIAITAELERARSRFPMPNTCLTAAMEELGELAQAFMKHNARDVNVTAVDVYTEAMQLACMAIRIMEEGTSEFPRYVPEDVMQRMSLSFISEGRTPNA